MSFLDPFGGSSVQPATVSYRAIALAASLALVWPPVATSDTNVVARTMDVTPSGPGFTITMPDATAVSPGYDFLISNLGASSFSLLDNAGGAIATLAPGAARYVQLKTTATAAGTWSTIAFGATAAAPDAAALAGLGLTANGANLQVSLQTLTFSSNYVATALDRAKVYVWTGGVGAFTLPMGATATQYYFLEVRNQGSGVLTITPSGGETIDAQSSVALQPNDSCFVHSTGGSAWYTVGRGRNQQFSFTLLSKAVTTGTVALTATEASNVVQRYTGALVGNVEVVFPSVVQVYYVSNQTTGAFTLTFRTAGVGSVVTVPTGQNAVLFCDGTNVINNSTTASGLTSLILSPGSVTAPSITYTGDTSTGIYQPTSSTVAVTTAGVERARWSNTLFNVTTALTAAGVITGPLGAVAAPSYSFASDPNTGFWSPGADIIAGSTGGNERFRVGVSGLEMPLGAVALPSYSFAGDLNNGWWSPAADTQAWSTAGAERLRLSSTGVFTPGADGTQTLGSGSFHWSDVYSFALIRNTAGDLTINAANAAGQIALRTAGAERLRVDSAGLITVQGASSTANLFRVGVNSGAASLGFPVTVGDGDSSSAGTNRTYVRIGRFADGTAGVDAFAAGVGAADFGVGRFGTVTMRFTAGGAVSVVAAATGATSLFSVGDTTNGRYLASIGDIRFSIGQFVGANVREILTPGTSSFFIGSESTGPISLINGGSARLTITSAGLITDSAGLELGYKVIPRTTSIASVASQRGKAAALSAGYTITGSDGWVAGDSFAIYNDSAAAITITQGGSTTLRLAGTATTGSRTLAARGWCTVWCNATNEFVLSGPGLT